VSGPVSHEEILDRLVHVEGRLEDGSQQFKDIKEELSKIRDAAAARGAVLDALAQDSAATRELVELLAAAKRAGRFAAFVGRMFGGVLKYCIRLIKIGGAIAAAIAAYFVLLREWVNFLNPKG
jgi:hypothetical protein